jgi:hypothetical protein
LEQALAKLDPDEMTRLYSEKGLAGLPCLTYRPSPDFLALVRPIPVKSEARGVPRERPIGALTEGAVRPVPSAAEKIRRAIRRKLGKYGELDVPYVVAVNAIDYRPPREDEIVEAFRGDVEMESRLAVDGTVSTRFVRARNGVFGEPGSPKNTRLSAVLLAAPATVWNLTTTCACVCRNPAAARPLGDQLSRFPTITFESDKLSRADGATLGQLLGLEPGWPHPQGPRQEPRSTGQKKSSVSEVLGGH